MSVSIYSSALPEPTLPATDIASYLLAAAEGTADLPALHDAGCALSYRQLRHAVETLAAHLQQLCERGVLTPGAPLVLRMPNSAGFVISYLAALRQGFVLAPVNIQLTDADVSRHATLIGATAQLTLAESPAGITVRSTTGEYHLDWAESTPPVPAAQPAADDPAVIAMTSGTSGTPQAVVLSHRNLISNCEAFITALDSAPQQRLLTVLPLSHIYGLTVLLGRGLRQHCQLIMQRRFDFAQFQQLTAEHAVTELFLVPPILTALARHPAVDPQAYASVEMVLSGAAPLDPEIAAAVAARLGTTVRQGYGMTELSPVSHVCAKTDDRTPITALGRALGGVQWSVRDPATGQPAERGELWVRSAGVMLGYLQAGDELASPSGGGVDAQGFVHTGDLVRVEQIDSPAGAYAVPVLEDRLKDILLVRGYSVSPVELERLLLTHPQVADAAVGAELIGDDELPVGYVVAQDPEAFDEADLLDFFAAQVAPFKRLRRIYPVAAIPRSAAGKTLRHALPAAVTTQP